MSNLNPFIVYLGCAAAIINCIFYIRSLLQEKRPKAETYTVTSGFPGSR